MSDTRTFVIVGAGQAGRWLALTLRAEGFAGRIVWFGEEAHRPYDRPPLSKAVLKGDTGLAQLALIADDKFAALDLQWHSGVHVTAIDRVSRSVIASNGETVGYDTLFLANGGRARMLPGLAPHARVCALRTWEDAQALKARIDAARHVLVLGGGWIGLEVAASARLLGREVTVLEAAPRLCIRTVPPCVSEHLYALHRGRGVALRLGAAVTQVQPDDDGVSVTLADGETVRGDLLVVGIGLVASDALAAAAGLSTGNGVLTDASGRTQDTAIFAVGDVANALRADGQRLRIESWENAQRQAVAAAKAALGITHDPDAEGPPWFWSDQYDDNLQVLGLPSERHRIVERSDPAKRQRVFFFCDGTKVCAVAAVNAGREVKIARKWMRERRFPAIDALTDTTTDLSKLPLGAALPEQPA
jgi:3-phenylpropionate/trans-cinnamate dioxygenase ferredoxin reductase subunit